MSEYERIRSQKEHSHAVSVNHRALITRTLTKYPVNYALFRELLQNSADAKANTATIHFFSANSSSYATDISQIHSVPIKKLVFSNDGLDFVMDDWNRLKEIARGNPNETKIGAFGVGFYSVFELTDEPLVHSGSKIISFHYQGDQLQYKWADAKEAVKGAVIDLPYRAPGTLPNLVKFTAFLVQSFALVPLNKVLLKLDDIVLLELSKQSSTPFNLSLPQSLNAKSPNGMLKLASTSTTPFQLTVEYLNATQMRPISMSSGFFSIGKKLVESLLTKSDNPAERTKLVCFLRRTDAVLNVSISSSFRKKMIDTVMKAPPPQSTMSLLSFSKEELDNSDIKPPLSGYIFPTEFNDAKIFIGFPTKQSTAFKSHLALNQVVPTMERTAVDMSNAFVKDWNSELLYMAGVMARCVYEGELRDLAATAIPHQLAAAKYTMERFQFGTSAPDQMVGACIASGFWKCSKIMLLPTQMGILPSAQVRLAGDFGPLLRHVPVIEKNESNKVFVQHLVTAGYVKKVSFEEVVADLRRDPVSPDLLIAAAGWLENNRLDLPESKKRDFKCAIKVKLGDNRIQSFDNVSYFQNAFSVDPGLPIPESCVPYDVVELLGESRMSILGLKSLPLDVWAEFMVSDRDRLSNNASEFLATLNRSWHALHENVRDKIVSILSEQCCIPTIGGLKIPSDAYVAKIALFPSLPTVNDTVRASKSFLVDIGVRESVDMAFVLEALHNSSSGFKWTTQDLVDYLVDNSRALKKEDWVMLRQGAFYRDSKSKNLVQVHNLYMPAPELSKLGFPVLEWSRPWAADSPAANILGKLGLKSVPGPVELFERALERNLVPTAIKFYLSSYEETSYYASLRRADLPIVPSNNTYSRPSSCFADKEVTHFGLAAIDEKYIPYAKKFGVSRKPPLKMLLDYLIEHPPRTMAEGDAMFGYLSKRGEDFSAQDIRRCSESPLIPVKPSQKLFARPSEVYLNVSDAGDFKELFYFVDALPASLPFLLKIGMKQTPSLVEIAWQTVLNPQKVFSMINDADKYTALLAKFHYGWNELSRDKALVKAMESASFLLALRHGTSKDTDANEEGKACLAATHEVSIVDDIMIFNMFKQDVLTAPQDTTLELFYERLGVSKLSQILRESCQLGNAVEFKDRLEVQSHVRERLKLFLESTSKPRRIRPKDVDGIIVEFVTFIRIRQQLRNTREIQSEITALIHPNHPNKLLLTPDYNWFHVSQALTKAVTQKPDPESVIVLELQLSTDLMTLQKKGYNVNRILKKKEKVELELPSEPAPPETARDPAPPSVKELDAKAVKPENASLPTKRPTNKPVVQKDIRPPPAATANAPIQRNSLPPPGQERLPTSPSGAHGTLGKLKSFLSGKGPSTSSYQQDTGVKVPIDSGTQQSILKQAIRNCQPYSAAQLHSPDHVDKPTEAVNTCRDSGSKDLRLALRLDNEIALFIKNGMPGPTPQQLVYARHFNDILKRCSAIYECSYQTLNIYIGELSSIAFNFNGSLFFNLAVFYQQTQGPTWQPAVVLDYWYTVMAHELAHNVVSSHGAQHSFFSESYVQTYLSRLRAQRLPESAPSLQ